jgi:hypothetical protein
MLRNIAMVLLVILAMYITAKYPQRVVSTVEFGYVRTMNAINH